MNQRMREGRSSDLSAGNQSLPLLMVVELARSKEEATPGLVYHMKNSAALGLVASETGRRIVPRVDRDRWDDDCAG